jgi:hypothetical protein
MSFPHSYSTGSSDLAPSSGSEEGVQLNKETTAGNQATDEDQSVKDLSFRLMMRLESNLPKSERTRSRSERLLKELDGVMDEVSELLDDPTSTPKTSNKISRKTHKSPSATQCTLDNAVSAGRESSMDDAHSERNSSTHTRRGILV